MLAACTVKIHHVQPSVACFFKAHGHFHGVTVLTALRIIALCEAYAASVYNVYGRYQLYHIAPRKLVRIRSPTLPLFSGWNWVAMKLPLRIAALKGRICRVVAMVKSHTGT